MTPDGLDPDGIDLAAEELINVLAESRVRTHDAETAGPSDNKSGCYASACEAVGALAGSDRFVRRFFDLIRDDFGDDHVLDGAATIGCSMAEGSLDVVLHTFAFVGRLFEHTTLATYADVMSREWERFRRGRDRNPADCNVIPAMCYGLKRIVDILEDGSARATVIDILRVQMEWVFRAFIAALAPRLQPGTQAATPAIMVLVGRAVGMLLRFEPISETIAAGLQLMSVLNVRLGADFSPVLGTKNDPVQGAALAGSLAVEVLQSSPTDAQVVSAALLLSLIHI